MIHLIELTYKEKLDLSQHWVQESNVIKVNETSLFLLFFPSEATECVKNGLVCPTGTICAQVNGIYDCTCKTGFKIVIKLGRKTCQGKK